VGFVVCFQNMAKYPEELNKLIAYLKKLPGVGSKTAERYAFQLLNWPEEQLQAFADHMAGLPKNISYCEECFCMVQGECTFCTHPDRNVSQQLCVIAHPKDTFSVEETGVFKGLYHVLGGLLSPIEGKQPEHLRIESLRRRIEKLNIQEIIIALDSTLEGDTTALYLKQECEKWGVRASRLAFGIPIGSSLDFIDGGTLSRALLGRRDA
jgi:recombination protein RecR